MDSSTVICWTSPFVILRVSGVWSILSLLFYFLKKKILRNNVDPDQMPQNLASDLGLHCSSIHFYGFPGKNGLNTIVN